LRSRVRVERRQQVARGVGTGKLSVTSNRGYKFTNGRPTQDEERVSLTADSKASPY